jgi:hypothetical protein
MRRDAMSDTSNSNSLISTFNNFIETVKEELDKSLPRLEKYDKDGYAYKYTMQNIDIQSMIIQDVLKNEAVVGVTGVSVKNALTEFFKFLKNPGIGSRLVVLSIPLLFFFIVSLVIMKYTNEKYPILQRLSLKLEHRLTELALLGAVAGGLWVLQLTDKG